jgi:hypothetical protein
MARDKACREAELKIEKARCTGVTELRLSSMELTRLLEAAGQVTQFQT